MEEINDKKQVQGLYSRAFNKLSELINVINQKLAAKYELLGIENDVENDMYILTMIKYEDSMRCFYVVYEYSNKVHQATGTCFVTKRGYPSLKYIKQVLFEKFGVRDNIVITSIQEMSPSDYNDFIQE